MFTFLAFLLSVVGTVVAIPLLVRHAETLGILDLPNRRKIHLTAVPRVGGIAMACATMLSIALWLEHGDIVMGFLAGGAFILVFGFWDDNSDLDYRLKFLGQIAAACALLYVSGVLFERIPIVDGFLPTWMAVTLSMLFIVGVTNAINLADGLDGLAAGCALISLTGIAVLSYLAGGAEAFGVSIALIGSILGFLRFNTHPAVIFMGDTGSQFLGLGIGFLSIAVTQVINPALSPMVTLCIVGVPVLDTVYVMLRRMSRGQSPFSPDRTHIHHRLLALGLRQGEAVAALYAVQAAFVMIAVLLRYESDILLIGLYASICLAILVGLFVAEYRNINLDMNVWAGRPWVESLNMLSRYRHLGVNAVRLLVAVVVVLTAWFSGQAPFEFSLAACALALLLSIRLLVGYKAWFLYLRLLIYMSVALIVYVSDVFSGGMSPMSGPAGYALYGLLVLSALVAMRYSGVTDFRFNATDFLILFLVSVLGLVPPGTLEAQRILPAVVKVVVLLYASEFALKTMTKRFNVFSLGLIIGNLLLAARVVGM